MKSGAISAIKAENKNSGFKRSRTLEGKLKVGSPNAGGHPWTPPDTPKPPCYSSVPPRHPPTGLDIPGTPPSPLLGATLAAPPPPLGDTPRHPPRGPEAPPNPPRVPCCSPLPSPESHSPPCAPTVPPNPNNPPPDPLYPPGTPPNTPHCSLKPPPRFGPPLTLCPTPRTPRRARPPRSSLSNAASPLMTTPRRYRTPGGVGGGSLLSGGVPLELGGAQTPGSLPVTSLLPPLIPAVAPPSEEIAV